MPLSDQDIAAINSGLAQINQTAGVLAQAKLNKKTMQWNEKMYGRQRADALADWNMTNEYNLPVNQMARFKAAGLNPNLIYGRGDSGSATAVRSSSPGSWNPKAPDFTGVGTAYVDSMTKYQSLENMKQAKENAEAQNKLIAAQTLNNLSSADYKKLGVDNLKIKNMLDSALLPFRIDAGSLTNDLLRGKIDWTKAQTDFTITQKDIAEYMKEPNKNLAVQKLANLKIEEVLTQNKVEVTKEQKELIAEQIMNLMSTERLRDQLYNLREQGKNPGDPWYVRMLSQIVDDIMQKVLSSGKSGALPYGYKPSDK